MHLCVTVCYSICTCIAEWRLKHHDSMNKLSNCNVFMCDGMWFFRWLQSPSCSWVPP